MSNKKKEYTGKAGLLYIFNLLKGMFDKRYEDEWITKEEFDKLPQEVKDNGTTYWIGDGEIVPFDPIAKNIKYGDSNVETALDTVTDDITQLKNTTTWKLIGSATNNNTVSVNPNSYEEFHIVLQLTNQMAEGGDWSYWNFHCISEELKQRQRMFNLRIGYYVSSSDYGSIVITFNNSDSTFRINSINLGGRSYKENATMLVYAR